MPALPKIDRPSPIQSKSAKVVLDGIIVDQINSDLTASRADLTKVVRLHQSSEVCFEGGQKYGDFDISGDIARQWLAAPQNPNGRPNSDVLRPYLNATDVVRRGSDRWIVDFGSEMSERDAELYALPFAHVSSNVRPSRVEMPREVHRTFWWRHGWVRLRFDARRLRLKRYLVTPVVAKHRLFAWVHPSNFSSNLLDTIARDDDTTFGILHSRFHELWSLRMCTWLGVGNDPRYTPTTCFETFPFPEGLTPDIPAAQYANDPRAKAIAEAAARLNELREAWLNPPDLVKRVPEVVPGLSRPHPARQRQGCRRPQEAHAHQSLQRATRVAGQRPPRPRRRRGRRLRLAGRPLRRANPRAPVQAQSGARRVPVTARACR